MTSYSGLGPYEQLFAEAQARQRAGEQPRKLIVVLGTWLLLSMEVLCVAGVLFIGLDMAWPYVLVCTFGILLFSLVMILKTTRSYFNRPRVDEERDS